jgi:GMP synthase (glutamine-hydrolysing)
VKPLLLVKVGSAVAPVLEARGDFEVLFAAILGGKEALLVVDATKGGGLPDPTQYRGVIVPGSSASVRDEAPWMQSLQGWIRGVVEAKVPLLGVCFGHQLLGEALGGRVEKNPAGREIGTVAIELTKEGALDPLFFGVPRIFRANATHVDAVVRLPPGATVLATNDHGLQAFRAAPSAAGVQFHPEMDADVVRGYVGARADAIAAEGLDPSKLVRSARDCPLAVMVVRNFAGLDPIE